MNDRERRDFDAGLREEVDCWLRGDTSRRTFLTKLVLMGGAAFVATLTVGLGAGRAVFAGRVMRGTAGLAFAALRWWRFAFLCRLTFFAFAANRSMKRMSCGLPQ